MTVFKSGDLVVLKSGGPTMTVDTVNTDIFDDDKITGVLCVWFVGDKLQRVRFDHQAIEPAPLQKTPLAEAAPAAKKAPPAEPTGEYQAVLDDMVDAMNPPAEAAASRTALRKPKPAQASKRGTVSGPTIVAGVGGSTIG
ncbi:Uncharacterized conserved protein YodC, DUF2158 family [Bradyrhizobium lablabi]|uniref:Uncharacterized conserved protein YodC, DUF2158 family n=1 Tax=Bradyrhizobium lablabi TaxID=722472 RepID=A0A1M7BSG7_9BRAD|nr:DUF2158 domain-containing protein [Bradyrhizobium lablabi]SHL57962.1 Uncharacterized conserved protein YodC, DUF2158 family [Bradyrhizobium lablabi]